MSIEKASIPWSVNKLTKNVERLRFDHAVQRNSDMWKPEQKSLFIHSLMYGYPIPPIYAVDEGDTNMWILDGKQRLTTVLSFVADEWELAPGTPHITVNDAPFDVSGTKFSDLPDNVRTELLATNLNIVQMRGLAEDEFNELFRRLNNGTALRPIELTRAMAGTVLMRFVQTIAVTPFFAESAKITAAGRHRFTHEEVVMQCIMLLATGGPAALDSKTLRAWAVGNKSGLDKALCDKVSQTATYLSEAFPEPVKYLKKVNLPMLFVVAAEQAIPGDVDAQSYRAWADDFFAHRRSGDRYMQAASGSTAKLASVERRLLVMAAEFTEWMALNKVDDEEAI